MLPLRLNNYPIHNYYSAQYLATLISTCSHVTIMYKLKLRGWIEEPSQQHDSGYLVASMAITMIMKNVAISLNLTLHACIRSIVD